MVDFSDAVGHQDDSADHHETGQASALFHPLADELMAVATRLRCVANAPALPPRNCAPCQLHAPRRPVGQLALARKIYTLRRKRAAIFGNADLFGEPAWDILLDLFIAQAESKDVSVSSACIGSAAPATTALRWLGVLTEEGLIARENDPQDTRRVLVRLTPAGLTAMNRFLETYGAEI